MGEYSAEEKAEFEKDFVHMKKQQAKLVRLADDRGYFFSDLECSILSKIGNAKSWEEVSAFAAETFIRFYPSILKKIRTKKI